MTAGIALPLVLLVPPAAVIQPALAQTANPQDLRKLERQLDQSRSRTETLEAEARELAAETQRLAKRLVATAARVQAREAQISATEERLAGLNGEEDELERRLVKRRKVLAEILAGLQRLEQHPPPALAVKPRDALQAVRSAMLLGVVVPELRVEANAIARDLTSLRKTRRAIQREQRYLTQNLASLEAERHQVTELLAAKKAASRLTEDEIRAERARMEKLAERARSLQDLIARIEKDKIEKGRQNAAAAEPATPARQAAARATALLKPALPFSKAKGALAFPAQGVRIREFGAADEFGGTAKGLSIATRASAQVTTPCDGWIVYAGRFRSYGQLLIINAGEGYHVLLAGMERLDVETGQFVRAGEPVGTMGESAVVSTAIGAEGADSRPVLYVEFRNDGDSVDPGPWWAGHDEKVRG